MIMAIMLILFVIPPKVVLFEEDSTGGLATEQVPPTSQRARSGDLIPPDLKTMAAHHYGLCRLSILSHLLLY